MTFSPSFLIFFFGDFFPVPTLLKRLSSCCFPPWRPSPLPLHVYLRCCSLWLSLPTVDESVDWLKVVSEVGSAGLAMSHPASLCHSSLQSGKQDETVPVQTLTTVKGPQTHVVLEHTEKWDWVRRRKQGGKRVRHNKGSRKISAR